MSKAALTLTASKSQGVRRAGGFTLVELLVVVAVIAVLAGILLPTLAKSKSRAQAILCLNNTKQLTLAWIMYADDHGGCLAYNLGRTQMGPQTAGADSLMAKNWANNVLDWSASNPDNTNVAKLVRSGLGPYVDEVAKTYRCPSDDVLSGAQRAAGWRARVRSYSMNAMVGNPGNVSQPGYNVNNPDDVQFLGLDSIQDPAHIFVFLDEHPDSIHDGYFLEQVNRLEWHELPASYHDGGATFSFADGHSEIHRWHYALTMPPSLPFQAHLPLPIPANQTDDYHWVTSRMSMSHQPDVVTAPGD